MSQRFEPITDDRVRGIISIQMLRGVIGAEQYYISADDEPNDTITQAAAFGVSYATDDYDIIKAASDQKLNEIMVATFADMRRVIDRLQFEDLYKEWQSTRSTLSSIVGDIPRNPAYYQIVGMGPPALPLIIERLREETKTGEPDHWFPALGAITRQNPDPENDQGIIDKMAVAWLKWRDEHGERWSAQAMGETSSQSW